MTQPILPLLEHLKPLEERSVRSSTPGGLTIRNIAPMSSQIMMQFFLRYSPSSMPMRSILTGPAWTPGLHAARTPTISISIARSSSDYSYRISGNRGTVKMVTFTTQLASPVIPWENDMVGTYYNESKGRSSVKPDGGFELLLSTERPRL
jgi:hypothetical protein